MRYADISKRRTTAAEIAKSAVKEKRETIRFKVGGVYLRGRRKYVCVKRFTGDKGDVLWFVELAQHRRNMKNFWSDKCEDDECFFGYEDELDVDCSDIMLVRTYDGIEYAAEESTVLELEERSVPQQEGDGRYDFDDVEEIDKREFEFRADKSCGEELIEPQKRPQGKVCKKKSKQGDAIAGLIIIVFIVFLIKACVGS